MLMTIANSSAIEAARVGFHAAFIEQLALTTANPLEALFTEISSTTGVEEWNWLGDLPDFEEWKGDRFLSELAAYKLRITNKDWASGIRIHQNQIADDNTGLIAPLINQLAQKARGHRARLAMRHLINGFAGTAFPDVGNGLGYDGNFFFSTTHATGSNRLAVALDAAGLNAAELLLQSQTNFAKTESVAMSGTHLIVGPKLVPVAQKLMLSEFLPNAAGTATESNYHKGRYTVVTSPLLTGTYDDYWFLADLSQPIKPFIFQNREDITTSAVEGQKGGTNDSIPRFQRGEIWFGAEARYNVGYFEHRTIVGSAVA